MATVTWKQIEPLLDQFEGGGPMVSCYADLSVERGFQSRWQGPLKAAADRIKKDLDGDHRSWHDCQQNLDAIRAALEAPEARSAKGMAVFSAGRRGFFRSFPLDVPVENALVVHKSPYLVPLLQALLEQRAYLVVHADTHRARQYAAGPGGLWLLDEMDEDVPRKQHSSGQRWGMEQATIARHRDERISHYEKELAGRVQRLWDADAFRGMILLGEHEVAEQVRARLPARLAAQVVGEAACAWTDPPHEFDERVCRLVREAAAAQERRCVEQFRSRAEEDYGVAAGAAEVLSALQQGQLGPRGHGYLLMGPDLREAVARCTACRWLSVDMPTSCPRCGAPCAESNLWEEVLLFALRHDIAVHFLRDSAALGDRAGIAAVLGASAAATAQTAPGRSV
jgi:peptide subunit release factor 1 (eRF1)